MPTIDTVISVSTAAQGGGAGRRDFGRTMYLTTADLSLAARAAGAVQAYRNATEADGHYAQDDDVLDAANIYFSRTSPRPRHLVVGRWNETAVDAELRGSGSIGTVAEFVALGAAATITYGSVDVDVDVSAVGDLAAVATAAQAAIRTEAALPANVDAPIANLDAVDVSYDAAGTGAFVFNIAVGDGEFLATGFTGDLADEMGLGTFLEAAGDEAETLTDAVARILVEQDAFMICPDTTISDDVTDAEALARWVAARPNQFELLFNHMDSAIETTNEEASAAAVVGELQFSGAGGCYTRENEHQNLSIASVFSGIRYDSGQTHPTLNIKTGPGLVADEFTTTVVTELRRKRLNHFIEHIAGKPVHVEGWNYKTDEWLDEYIGLAWYARTAQRRIYQIWENTPKVPNDDNGNQVYIRALNAVSEIGVRARMIVPGTVDPEIASQISDAIAGEGAEGDIAEFAGFLPTGFLNIIQSVSTLTTAQRIARELPSIYMFFKGGGAGHSAGISILLAR